MSEKKIKAYHIISMVILTCSAVFVTLYFDRVWARTWQAMKDVYSSIAWLIKGKVVTPTVNTMPTNAVGILPFDFSEFKVKLKAFGKLFIDWNNVKGFFLDVALWILLVVCVLIPWIIWIISAWLKGKGQRRSEEKVVHNLNQETKPLRIFKKIEDVIWYKPKAFMKDYKWFLEEKRYYKKLFYLIWGMGLNFGTIALELVAYVLFLFRGFDLSKIYLQIAKLAMDLTVAIDFVPHIVWAYIGWKKFDKWRRARGMAILEGFYDENVEFLERYKGALFIVGGPRTGKSTILQAIVQMKNIIFRKEALKGIQKKDKQFPNFPWINVLKFLQEAEKKRTFPTMASYRIFIKRLKKHYENEGKYSNALRELILKYYRKLYCYEFNDFIFGYDDAKYKMKHNNGLVFVDIFKAISDYVQQLHLYAHRTSLAMGNISIRSDIKKEDYGNFPTYDYNSIRRTPEDIERYSQFAHVKIYDSVRTKFVDENNPYRFGWEYGIEYEAEWAKERGNQYSNQGKEKKDTNANQKNDGYEMYKKIQGQMATIDNYDYSFGVYDDQREGSISAENSDNCTVITIAERIEKKVVLPFYAVEQAIGLLANGFYDAWKLDKKVMRDDITLREYLVQKVCIPIFEHCERIENKFGVEGRRLKVKHGPTDKIISEKEVWWIIYAHDYNEKFSTDALQTYATERARRSKYGLEDFPVFQSINMTFEEMNSMGSYFYDYMNSTFMKESKSA